MRRRLSARGLSALGLLAPFALVALFVDQVADRQAASVVEGLCQLSDALNRVDPELDRDQEQVALWRAELAALLDELPNEPADARAEGSARPSRAVAPAPKGLFVSAEKVLGLARAGARPLAIPVGASGARPAGLLLTGVGGLGVGLRDGDILTHALGQPAVSEEGVVGAIIRARGAREPQLSGRVWRDGRSFALVVAQPYLDSG